jgi:hypothetical protein
VNNFLIDRVFPVIMGALLLGSAALFVLAIYSATLPAPPSIELVRADWTCTASHSEQYTTFMVIGKVTVPQVHTREVCDRYQRRK